MMLIVVSLVVVSGQFFSMLHELQEIVDSETQHALSRQASSEELEAALRRRVVATAPGAQILSITHTSSTSGERRARRISVQGRYEGPLLEVLNGLIPAAPLYVPFAVDTSVRGASAASLILLDATVSSANSGCTDPDLIQMESFAGTLANELTARSATRVVAAVLPRGAAHLAEISLAQGRSDGLSRCAGRSSAGLVGDAFAIKGEVPAVVDAVTLSAQVAALLSSRVLSGPDELTSIALILRHRMHDDGTAAALLDALQAEARRLKRKVYTIVCFVGAATQYQESSRLLSRYGLDVRQIYGPRDSLFSPAFVHAAVSTMSDRIVVAQ
jgi:hypothetical protein